MNAYNSGDHCLLKTIDGQPCAVHYDCDDYSDGTITNVITGKRVVSDRYPLSNAL